MPSFPIPAPQFNGTSRRVAAGSALVREKTDSYMGAASYRMQAQRVEPYVERPR